MNRPLHAKGVRESRVHRERALAWLKRQSPYQLKKFLDRYNDQVARHGVHQYLESRSQRLFYRYLAARRVHLAHTHLTQGLFDRRESSIYFELIASAVEILQMPARVTSNAGQEYLILPSSWRPYLESALADDD